MQITIYRGTKEIGGSLIEVRTASTRILIDAGFPLFLGGRPIDEKIARAPYQQLLETGVLPDIKGLYAWDEPGFDAVLVSHVHIDQHSLLRYIHPGNPIWMSAGTRTIIEIMQRFKICESFPTVGLTFKMYEKFPIGGIMVTPFLMDHSAFDAAAFQLSAEGKTVIYGGDLRGHGRTAASLNRFLDKTARQADLLLIEGSTLGRPEEHIASEDALVQALIDQGMDFKGPILFECDSQNIDRLVSFYRAARQLKRTLVIDIYTANVLHDLRQLGHQIPFPSEEHPEIKVFFPHSLTDKIFRQIGVEYANRFSPYFLAKETITAKQNRLMMLVRPPMIRDLERCELRDGLFFYSLWNGYRDTEQQQRFESSLRQSGFALRVLHTSGYASVADIRRVIHELDPRRVIAISALHAKAFADLPDRVELLNDGMVQCPNQYHL